MKKMRNEKNEEWKKNGKMEKKWEKMGKLENGKKLEKMGKKIENPNFFICF